MSAPYGLHDARLEQVRNLYHGQFCPDNRRAVLPILYARSQGAFRVGHNVRAADLRLVRDNVMSYFGTGVYYKMKQQRRVITEREQQLIRQSFTEMGYDGSSISFDRYEEQYPALMPLSGKK